jgi:hypothetical protein
MRGQFLLTKRSIEQSSLIEKGITDIFAVWICYWLNRSTWLVS